MKVAVDSFSDDSKNDVLDANDVVVLDGSPVKRNSSHIRNLFLDEESNSNSKRTFDYDASSSPCKRNREGDEVELLMVEEDDNNSSDNNDLMDIQSMLEVTMEEESTDVETDSAMGELEEKEIIEVDLDPEVSFDEDTDILCVDDQDNIIFNKAEFLADNDLADSSTEIRKHKSIKDLVMQWASEEEALISKTPEVGKIRTKKSRKDLKPKPYQI